MSWGRRSTGTSRKPAGARFRITPRQRRSRQADRTRRLFFERYDVLALPATQVPPFDIDCEWVTEVDRVAMETYIDWMRSCSDVTSWAARRCRCRRLHPRGSAGRRPVRREATRRRRLLRSRTPSRSDAVGDVRPADVVDPDVPNPDGGATVEGSSATCIRTWSGWSRRPAPRARDRSRRFPDGTKTAADAAARSVSTSARS